MADLTKEQIDELQQNLKDERAHIIGETRERLRPDAKENFVDIAGEVGDMGDGSVAGAFIDMDNAIIGRRLQQIREIDAALVRIKTGEFGTCINCGCDIGYERLSVYPSAERCILCQSQHEKTYSHEPRFAL